MAPPLLTADLDPVDRHSVGLDGNTIVSFHSRGLDSPVVCLHGSSTSSEVYHSLLHGKLGKIHQVVCIDLPGHGQSSKAISPEKTYSLQGYIAALLKVVEVHKLERATFVGSGMGADILVTASADGKLPLAHGLFLVGSDPESLSTLSSANVAAVVQSFVASPGTAPASLGDILLGSDPKHRDILRKGEIMSLSTDQLKVPFAVVKGLEDSQTKYISQNLWRDAIQVIPAAKHLVAMECPAVLTTMIRNFIADAPMPAEPDIVDSTFGATSGVEVKPVIKGAALRPEPKTHVNPKARYEAPHPDDTIAHYRSYETTTTGIENARGRIAPGTAPHPGMRFEGPGDSADNVDAVKKTGEDINRNTHAAFKGRVPPGTAPHPSSRFELPTDDIDHRPVGPSVRQEAASNPNARGRIVGGTMPHLSSRFDYDPNAGSGSSVINTVAPADGVQAAQEHNPNVRGRIQAGTVPHPSSRFHNHNQLSDAPPVPYTGMHVRKPPGGGSSITFG